MASFEFAVVNDRVAI